jgi:hypothetical protein
MQMDRNMSVYLLFSIKTIEVAKFDVIMGSGHGHVCIYLFSFGKPD